MNIHDLLWHDTDIRVLHWQPTQDRWVPIAWADWTEAGGGIWGGACPHGIGAGVQHFVVVILADGRPCNIIPHKYLIAADGHVRDTTFDLLTDSERAEYDRLGNERAEYDRLGNDQRPEAEDAATWLHRTMHETVGAVRRLNELRAKAYPVRIPPPDSIAALRRALPSAPDHVVERLMHWHEIERGENEGDQG